MVVPNFRLGFLGFLAHPELSKESPSGTSGNQGILDCIQALQWIQDNIASFGGDPARVTVGGQSSGSAMARGLSLSPLWRPSLISRYHSPVPPLAGSHFGCDHPVRTASPSRPGNRKSGSLLSQAGHGRGGR